MRIKCIVCEEEIVDNEFTTIEVPNEEGKYDEILVHLSPCFDKLRSEVDKEIELKLEKID